MDEFAIDIQACRDRQKRLLKVMHAESLDLVVVQLTEHVQWLTGPRFGFPRESMTSRDGVVNKDSKVWRSSLLSRTPPWLDS